MSKFIFFVNDKNSKYGVDYLKSIDNVYIEKIENNNILNNTVFHGTINDGKNHTYSGNATVLRGIIYTAGLSYVENICENSIYNGNDVVYSHNIAKIKIVYLDGREEIKEKLVYK